MGITKLPINQYYTKCAYELSKLLAIYSSNDIVMKQFCLKKCLYFRQKRNTSFTGISRQGTKRRLQLRCYIDLHSFSQVTLEDVLVIQLQGIGKLPVGKVRGVKKQLKNSQVNLNLYCEAQLSTMLKSSLRTATRAFLHRGLSTSNADQHPPLSTPLARNKKLDAAAIPALSGFGNFFLGDEIILFFLVSFLY